MNYFISFCIGFFSTLGFTIIFNVPKKYIIYASTAGAISLLIYMLVFIETDSKVFASFLATCVIAIIGEIFARVLKVSVTVFVIPAILPLVPGAGMYYTMLAFVNNDFNKVASTGTETLFIAGSIATGLLIIPSFTRAMKKARVNFNINVKRIKNKML